MIKNSKVNISLESDLERDLIQTFQLTKEKTKMKRSEESYPNPRVGGPVAGQAQAQCCQEGTVPAHPGPK